jgi:Asp-tRNA(Asn)/Glu-tRNA(Gln) amidotransferase A subunit family amidase
VADAAAVLQAIAGYDALDISSADEPVADYDSGLSAGAKNLRVGIPRAYFFDNLDSEVGDAVGAAIGLIASLVAEVKEVKIDVVPDRTVQAAESFAFHADGIAHTPELFQPETQRRIRSGENISATDYIKRRGELDEERRRAGGFFTDVDLLVTPTTPIAAPAIAGLKQDPDALRPAELLLLRNTRPFNVWGLPAISVPCGITSNGMPIGLQIAGPHWREDLVLRLAGAYEAARGRS